MRRFGYALGLLLILAACHALADDAAAEAEKANAQPVAIRMTAEPRDIRDYKVDAIVKGKAPSDAGAPGDVDAAFSYKIRHRYGRRDADGTLPVEVSLVEGEVTTMGQKLTITPSLYPKLTVVLNRDWKTTDIFGATESQLAGALPGINYSNMVLLFYLPDGGKPHPIGEKWESVIRLPIYGESYKLANVIKGTQAVDGIDAAIVQQEITRVPKEGENAAMKATAESAFAMDSGKLLKSHVDCEVTSTPSTSSTATRQDQPPLRANIKIDIALAKSAEVK